MALGNPDTMYYILKHLLKRPTQLGKLFLVINYMYNVTDKAVTGHLQLFKLHIELVNLGYVLYSMLYLYSYQDIHNNNIACLNNALTKI